MRTLFEICHCTLFYNKNLADMLPCKLAIFEHLMTAQKIAIKFKFLIIIIIIITIEDFQFQKVKISFLHLHQLLLHSQS